MGIMLLTSCERRLFDKYVAKAILCLMNTAVYLKTDGTTGQRRDRTERPSRSWRLYRRPYDETGPTTGRRDSLTADAGQVTCSPTQTNELTTGQT